MTIISEAQRIIQALNGHDDLLEAIRTFQGKSFAMDFYRIYARDVEDLEIVEVCAKQHKRATLNDEQTARFMSAIEPIIKYYSGAQLGYTLFAVRDLLNHPNA